MPSPYPFLELGKTAARGALTRILDRRVGAGVFDPSNEFLELPARGGMRAEKEGFENARLSPRSFLTSEGELAQRMVREQIQPAFSRVYGDFPPMEMGKSVEFGEVLGIFEPGWRERAEALGLVYSKFQPLLSEGIEFYHVPDFPPTKGLRLLHE